MRALILQLVVAAVSVGAIAQAPSAERAAELRARLSALAGDAEREPTAACNAGWLHFQLGAMAEATRLLDRGIAQLSPRGRSRRVLGACLYNRGRVAEAAGDVPTARDLYTRSIELRPNASVARRLDGLAEAAPTDPREVDSTQAWESRGDSTESLPAQLVSIPGLPTCISSTGVSRCSLEVVRHLVGGAGELLEVWLIWQRYEEIPRDWGSFFVIARGPSGFRISEPIAEVDSPGEGYEFITVQPSFQRDARGTFLLIRTTIEHLDHEVGEFQDDRITMTVVHGAGRGTLPSSSLVVSQQASQDGRTQTDYRLAVRFRSDGQAVVRRESGRLPENMRSAIGTRAARALGVISSP